MMRSFFIFVLLFISLGCHAANLTESVSIINLISTPEKYEGKTVRLVGVAKIEFEDNAIYLNQNDLKSLNYKNGIWLAVKKEQVSEFEKFSGKPVLVEGVFNSKRKGHLNLWSGSIDVILRIEEYPKEK